ncbi:uncharacterized protein LOC142356177 [Convolutriloba macropyga]|uniref:uncharacterized protein LOC142356177 n=1 Tax=Convolutriloba macropyga TaxID=536237 RepID=UPI003F525F24
MRQGLGYYRDGKHRPAKPAASGRSDSHKAASTSKKAEDRDEVVMGDASGGEGRSQQDLIRMAFAGDDVEAEFAEAKRAEVEAELPDIETPSVMPGWGTWTTQQREPRWMKEKREKAELERKRAAMARAGRQEGCRGDQREVGQEVGQVQGGECAARVRLQGGV